MIDSCSIVVDLWPWTSPSSEAKQAEEYPPWLAWETRIGKRFNEKVLRQGNRDSLSSIQYPTMFLPLFSKGI